MHRFRHAPVEIPPAWTRGLKRNGGSAGRRVGTRGAVGLRSARPALHVRKLPFADYAAAALYPTFTPFACSSSMNLQRRSRGIATLPRHACATRATRPYAVSFLPLPTYRVLTRPGKNSRA